MRKGFTSFAILIVLAIAVGLAIFVLAKNGSRDTSQIDHSSSLNTDCKKYGFSRKEDFLEKYTVKKGDTLLSISEQQLGDKSRIGELIKLNKDLYPGLAINKPFIERGWVLYLPPQGAGQTNGEIYEVNGEISINPNGKKWGVNFPNSGVGPFDKTESVPGEFKQGECIKVVYEGDTARVFSTSRQ